MKQIFFVLFVLLSFVACGLDADSSPPDPSTMDAEDLQEWGEEVSVRDPAVADIWNLAASGKSPGPEAPGIQNCYVYSGVRGCCSLFGCYVCFPDGHCQIYSRQ